MKGFAAIVLCLGCSAALAHTPLTTATPASGSILTQSPATLELKFGETVVLTALSVVVGTAPARNLQAMPKLPSDTFVVRAPQLARGRNEVRWQILSRDGHWNEGVIILVVR